MTIQQEAYEKIMRLPEDGIRLILVMADEIARQHGILTDTGTEEEKSALLSKKKTAFQNMLEMREQSTYPKDFEDCLQDECAVHANAEYIVTCNIKDFQHAKTSVVTPDVFVNIIAGNKN